MVSLAALFPFTSSISNVHRQVGWEKNERLPSHLFPAKNLPVGTLIRLDKQPVWFWISHNRGWRSVCVNSSLFTFGMYWLCQKEICLVKWWAIWCFWCCQSLVMHCKYLQFLIVSSFHCNFVVRFTLIT